MLVRSLLLCLLLSTVACSKTSTPPPPAPSIPSAAITAQPAVEAAVATPAPTAATSPTPATAVAALQDSDYQVIADGKPYRAAAGGIEVVEFFNYICPACNSFDPMLQAWKAKLPADVRLVYVPADFREDFAIYARAYYAADLLGIAEKTHEAVYEAIHETHTLPGEGRLPDTAVIAAFYGQHGVTSAAFLDAMNSFAVNTRMSQGRQYEMASQLNSTPSLLINGRYMVKGNSFEDKLRIAGQLIERERQKGTASK